MSNIYDAMNDLWEFSIPIAIFIFIHTHFGLLPLLDTTDFYLKKKKNMPIKY